MGLSDGRRITLRGASTSLCAGSGTLRAGAA
jgi:hypothetical protein